MEIERIFVVGAGTMGSGIAQTAAVSGYQATLMDVLPEQLQRAEKGIAKSVGKLFSNIHRLREETLDLPGSGNSYLIIF